jgi:TolB-like protein/DNA-binding winged helix-turn-helix (wHTH) protein/Flp pilus assembly protein TadD
VVTSLPRSAEVGIYFGLIGALKQVTTSAKANVIRFGVYEFASHSQELRKAGIRIRLEGQPLAILQMLLERPGELVTREELQRKLWPTDTFVDFEHSLNAAVKRLRAALNDSADQPRYVETLARRGYRFIAPLNAAGAETGTVASVVPPTPAVAPSPSIVRGRRVWLIAIAVFALAVGGWGWRQWRHRFAAPPVPVIRSLAVLPLTNLSGDPSQEYVADGMTEALIGRLSRIRDLRVISRTSVMRFKNSQLAVPEIAKTLRVDAIVEGSVIREGNRIRVHAQLIRAATDEHFWSEAYDREFRDVLTLQSEVAQTVAQQIQLQLTPEQQAQLRSTPAVNPDSYEAYLKGRFYEGFSTRATLKQAQGYYEEAARKDPTFALAYVGLADCYLDLGAYRLVSPQDAYRQSSAAVHKALQLDQALGEAHGSLGYLDWRYEWNWTEAERELRYAVELNPNSMESVETLIWYLSWSGRRSEALAEVDKMRQLDPAYPFILVQQSGVYYHQRDYKSLAEAGQKSVAAYPNSWQSHYFLAVGYEGSGRLAQAIPEYQRGVELSEADTDPIAGLAHASAAAGKRIEAEKILRELQIQSKTQYVSPYMIAVIYAALGNKNKAFEFLEKAYKEKSPDLAYFLKADLRIDPLRSDLRFQELLRRMNFPK